MRGGREIEGSGKHAPMAGIVQFDNVGLRYGTGAETLAGSKDVAGVTRMLAIPRSASADGEIRSSTALIVVNTFTPTTFPAEKMAMRVPGSLRCDPGGWPASLTNFRCAGHH